MSKGIRYNPWISWFPIEGSGGATVPYVGYVEVRMRISGIYSFDQDVLLLVSHTTTHCHLKSTITGVSHLVYSFLHVTGCQVKLEAKTQIKHSSL